MTARTCCECRCPCHDDQLLIGWKEIQAFLRRIGAGRLIGTSIPSLIKHSKELGMPTGYSRYGRVTSDALLLRHWLIIKFPDKNDWWPNGRTGKRSRSWEEHKDELEQEQQLEQHVA